MTVEENIVASPDSKLHCYTISNLECLGNILASEKMKKEKNKKYWTFETERWGSLVECQNSAEPGVRGNGIASLMLSIPVAN